MLPVSLRTKRVKEERSDRLVLGVDQTRVCGFSHGGPGSREPRMEGQDDPLGGPRTGKTPRSRAIESVVHRKPEVMSQLSIWRVRVIVWTRLDGD